MFRLLSLFICVFLCLGIHAETAIYVSSLGNDQNTGGERDPFATLEKARDTIRQLRKDRKLTQPVSVNLSGDFYLSDSFLLEQADSGEKDQPIVYRVEAGKTAKLTGGKPVENFEPVTDKNALARLEPAAQNHVVVAELETQGITDFGELKVRGMRNQADAPLELFFNGQPMQLAQYPNEGWLTIASLPGGNEGNQVTCDSTRLERWANASSAWAYGYWCYGWADFYLPVKSIAPKTHEIQLGEKPYYGLAQNQRFRMINLLEELDQPGEWYLDRDKALLYFWPPKPLAAGSVLVSISRLPLIQANDASNIRIEGLLVEATRSQGIAIQEGERVDVAGCTIRNVGGNGIVISGGVAHQVRSCEIYGCGEGGIAINGGDRSMLSPSSHAAVNNDIHHIGRIYHTYRPGISLSGVGNRAANNLIHDCPHQAFEYSGNDLLIERNEIHHVLLETDDAGAIYGGRDWTRRGNVIRGNYIHHSGPDFAPPAKPSTDPTVVTKPLLVEGIVPVYLDDLNSGALVENNILQGGRISVLLGGGRDNIVRNNVLIGAKYGVWLDARGLTWNKKVCSPGGSHRLYEMLKEVNHGQPPYSVHYPELVHLLDDEPQAPKGNRIERNIIINAANTVHAHDDIAKRLLVMENSLVLQLPDAEQPITMLQSITEAQMKSINFVPGAVEEIGLFKDAYRAVVPGLSLPTSPNH